MKIQGLSEQHPNLPIEIIFFFSKPDIVNGVMKGKTIMEFHNYYTLKYQKEKSIEPSIVANICDFLVSKRKLSLLKHAGPDNVLSSYVGFILDETLENNKKLQDIVNLDLSCLLYGFPYIYNQYKKYVLPVEYIDMEEKVSLGTCFLFDGGIVTAKHCIEGAKRIAIHGISKETLSSATFLIHKNSLMDIIFIIPKERIEDSILLTQDAVILDEVLTLGYPKIAGYHNFLSAENALVSARFTATSGQVAAKADDIWIREKLLLITAKIKGGNSGGPVINKRGAVVAVSVNMSSGEGDYDDLGYGTAIPIKYVIEEIVNIQEKIKFDVSGIEFVDAK